MYPLPRVSGWMPDLKNSIRKPPRKGKGVIGPARGIRHSNLEPGQSVFDLDKPRFDLNRFKTGQRRWTTSTTASTMRAYGS